MNKIRSNLLVQLLFFKTKGFFDKRSRIVNKFIRKFNKIDSIEDFEYFKETVLQIKKYQFPLDVFRFSTMSYYYGYYNELLKYSRSVRWAFPYVGEMEHGVEFNGAIWDYNKSNICYTSQGGYRINHIRKYDSYMPIFIIGPYIRYVRNYYSDEKIKLLKQKNGKTLLVFPSHSFEGDAYRNGEESYVEKIYNVYAKHFDTIIVCVYWNDVDDKDIALFKEKGAIIVSAGFRGDISFVRRLKTIIELSDCVVGNDLGTNIGCCLALNKKFIILDDTLRKRTIWKEYEDNYLLFLKAFGDEDYTGFTEEQLSLQKYLFEYYWGGSIYKTRDEIKSHFSLIKKMYKKSLYFVSRRNVIIDKMLEKKIKLTELEYQSLLESISI